MEVLNIEKWNFNSFQFFFKMNPKSDTGEYLSGSESDYAGWCKKWELMHMKLVKLFDLKKKCKNVDYYGSEVRDVWVFEKEG